MADDVDARLEQLGLAMFDLAHDGDADKVLAYLDAGVPADLTNDNGSTLLMVASYYGHTELVHGLVDRGADVNRLNNCGQSPLAGALFKGENDIVRYLMDNHADPDLGTPSAREIAARFGEDL
ncbi:ankyrin repeat domain-containing protein [Nocardioides speluncae]|uniref:ankyrin repeat domain-containing protein n=1 Tax=Nocardioides speluncae TaxID=2670337 RepID=UPI000D688FC9|nr:ankyrin repeat domain-containing protein [Nocardioides speluncae]